MAIPLSPLSARPAPRSAAETFPGRDRWPEGSLLALLPEAERGALLSAGVTARFGDNDYLVRQGDVGEYCYLLTDGMVKVTVAAESGVETTLAIRGPGDLIGEFAVIDGKPRTATAVSVGSVTAIRIGRAVYETLSQRHASTVAQHLVAKLRAETDRHVAERTWEARQLLAQVLYEFAANHGKPLDGGAVLAPITQAELGKLAGVGVSTTERELAKLRKADIIATHYGRILVRDMDYLRDIRFKNDKDKNEADKNE